MTEEEKAEEYLQSIEGDDCVIITDREERKQAFLAGLKAGRSQWHDLRKDPNDLPKDNSFVLVWTTLDCGITTMYGEEYSDGIIENGLFEGIHISDVIAWCEIPQFKE